MRSREADQGPSCGGVENKAGWWKREGTTSQSTAEEDRPHSESLPGVRYSEHGDGMSLTKGDPGGLDVTRKRQGLRP